MTTLLLTLAIMGLILFSPQPWTGWSAVSVLRWYATPFVWVLGITNTFLGKLIHIQVVVGRRQLNGRVVCEILGAMAFAVSTFIGVYKISDRLTELADISVQRDLSFWSVGFPVEIMTDKNIAYVSTKYGEDIEVIPRPTDESKVTWDCSGPAPWDHGRSKQEVTWLRKRQVFGPLLTNYLVSITYSY